MKIAIQGIAGSFHHIAANAYFGDNITLKTCLSFDEMPALLKDEKVDYLLMAIENSIVGSILPNYGLISDANLHIIGEVYLPIAHQLMSLKGQNIDDIKAVWSHPMAINQCREFLRNYPNIKIVEKEDTADAARFIIENKLENTAAIASEKAAKLYNLEIIAKDIHTNKDNYTRFFVLGKIKEKVKKETKISLKFITKHQQGSLAEVLNLFVKYNLNLSKIQSLPISNEPWKYSFFADLLLDESHDIDLVLSELRVLVQEVQVLGVYQNKNELYDN